MLASWKAAEYIQADGGSGTRSGVEQLQKERRTTAGQHSRWVWMCSTPRWKPAGCCAQWQEAGSRVGLEAVAKEEEVEKRRRRHGQNTSRHNRGLASAAKARAWFERVGLAGESLATGCRGIEVFWPDGRLNDRASAEARIAAALSELTDEVWAKTCRTLKDRRSLTFLGLHEHLQQAEPRAELREALVRLWWLAPTSTPGWRGFGRRACGRTVTANHLCETGKRLANCVSSGR